MGAPLTKKSIDHSLPERYSFSFFCDRCGKAWQSALTPFEAGGFAEVENRRVCEMLWAEEHRVAFERANLEAQFHFNYCPRCGRWVCEDCFCLDDNQDLCADCRKDKGEN